MSSVTLVLGGARSGKSEVAESLVAAHGDAVTYLATARDPGAADAGFAARIAAHRARRPAGWATVVVGPAGVATALYTLAGPVLVDSLGTWVAGAAGFAVDLEGVCAALRERDAPTVLVSDEVGLGVVPATAEGGAFRDALGDVNRAVAAVADDVFLVVAGRRLRLDAP